MLYNIFEGGVVMLKENDSFRGRLGKAIKIRNITQQKLSELTGINKGNISGYMNGKYDPKVDSIEIIAKSLNVNPIWLMGYNVSMEPVSDSIDTKKEEPTLSILHKLILDEVKDFSDDQLYKVIQIIKDMK